MDACSIASAFGNLLLSFSWAFTAPTLETFCQLATAWVLCPGRARVTRLVQTLGPKATKHWTTYEKFFYAAEWSLHLVCGELIRRVVRPLLESGEVDLHIDDTTVGRRGRHVAYAGWFKDASAAGKQTVIHWAHNWIIATVTIRLKRWPTWRLALPVDFELYRKRADCNRKHPFRTRQQLAARMVKRVQAALPDVRVQVAADGQYATADLAQHLPKGTSLVTRIRRDAELYDLAPKRRRPGQRGPDRKKGNRLPAPAQMAARRKKGWTTATLLKQGRRLQRQILGVTCLWPRVFGYNPVRVLLVRDPKGKEPDDFLVCSDPSIPDEKAVQRYLDRWGIEESIEDAKQHMSFESLRGWCARTVERQAPMAMILQTLVKVWYVQHAVDVPELQPQKPDWYPQKERPSFADMLAALRRVLWQKRVQEDAHKTGVTKLHEAILYALGYAA
jgi:hypothetical protein